MDTDTTYSLVAALAPIEIPSWFAHEEPIRDDSKKEPDWRVIKNAEDRDICSQWVRDGVFDLPEHLQWFGDQYNSYMESREKWNADNKKERYFQWRLYYAKELLNYQTPKH